MADSPSSPNSGGDLSPLRVSGACAHAAMQNVAPEAPFVNLASSDDGSVDAEPLVPKLPPLPLSLDDVDSSSRGDPMDSESSHGDTSDGDFVMSDQSTDSAAMSPKKPSRKCSSCSLGSKE